MFDLDTRLLQIFFEIYKHNSVSKAAEQLNIGQPTLSIALNKLREHFKDQLFVRIENKMQPTELSKQIYPLVVEILNRLKLVQSYNIEFDPQTSNYQFRISMTDISHLVLLPKLINYLRENAPNIRLEIIPITADTPVLMSNGEIDLAIGFLPQLEAGFYQQTLFQQHYVCIASQNHPRLTGPTLSDEEFRQELHIDIFATGGHYVLEHELQKLGVNRNILLRLPSYLGVGLVVQDTDAIATIPHYLSQLLLVRGNLQILELPYHFPTYSVKQHWHSRAHKTPSNQWLRQICFHLFCQ
ncbi:LysR family transcriptional regulator [Acinetobacter sp. S40]|uniref:LysR family transcriptional regulator n=1 Tax=unclassified Acinetobacter TaxID=196816 RepID=UPI001909B741|nr:MULTISPECIES: LysR family transcriptional regulator [unclassified Acinetobacter]MBJ9984676.1 LysR family transcriptional regulator [Acinetobacter sp. S40]MBK0062441.1 LysR family transcriptional regulator [Acinetobacter sp. S55]MBK0066245.1 LysR family transcriptional regulator [Acinetobacter sp. S54]